MLTLSKLNIRAAVAGVALAVALASPALHAQWVPERTQVIVPFAFEVGSTHFAPGTYILSNAGEHVVLVQNGKHSALTMSSPEMAPKPPATSKVVFHRYGNQYFLAEVWNRHSSLGNQIKINSRQTELTKNQSKDEVVLIASEK
jgi:hypothetical protein